MNRPAPVSWWRRPAASLAVYALLAIGLTWPLLPNLAGSVPSDIGDPLLNTWILAWDAHALLVDPLNLFNANIFHPLPNTLAYSEHLFSTALLALPLQLFSAEPIVAYNLSLLASFPLAAFGMYLLALHWTGQRSAAFIAGLIFGFAPYRFAAIAHLQLLTFQWLPFALLFLEKAVRVQGAGYRGPETERHRPWRDYALFGLFLLLQLLASWYLALYTGLIVSLYLLFLLLFSYRKPQAAPGSAQENSSPVTHPTSRKTQSSNPFTPYAPIILKISLVFTLVLALILPFALPYLRLLDELRAARPLSLALSLAAAPTDYLAAAPFNQLFGPLTAPFRRRPGFTEENVLFVGFVAPILAVIGLIGYGFQVRGDRMQGRRGAGTQATQNSSPIPSASLRTGTHHSSLIILLVVTLLLTFPTPYAWLAGLLPPTTIVRVPPRWIIPALFALAGLAAFGVRIINEKSRIRNYQLSTTNNQKLRSSKRLTPQASRLTRRFLFLGLSLVLLVETCSAPLPLAAVDNRSALNPAYRWLAGQPDSSQLALVELPLHSAPAPEFPEVKRLYASTLGWWRLVNGYSGYTPARQPELAAALAAFPAARSIETLQQLSATNYQLSELPNSTTQNLFDASRLTPHASLYLLVHPGEAPLDRSQWEMTDRWRAERNPALRPIAQFEGDYLYQVLPPDATRFSEPPLAAFGPAAEIELKRLAIDDPDARFQLPDSGRQHAEMKNSKLETQNPQLNPRNSKLILFWQPTAPPGADYTVFIHLRAADGFVRSQADGPPVSGHYPTGQWSPGEVIQDIHLLPAAAEDAPVDHLAIGLYDPATGQRLPAFDSTGQRLPDDALLVPFRR